MVPQITHPKSIGGALNYNEHKIEKQQATLLHSANFLKRPEELKFHEKLERFQKLMELNDRAKTKVIHISLNFHPDDAPKLSPEFLQKISDEYMQKIGFANQPYLVYQHNDAGHPHVHIVSTLIKEDGSRINTHNLGKDISEKTRKELEQKYDLVKADKREREQKPGKENSQAANAQKVQYGKSETKRSITNVLDNVIDRYKYTSLQELNAVLKLHNVMADRGNENGRIYKTGGLTYRVLDERGQKVGVPIKASDIYSKPTLKKLEEKFRENETKRESDKKPLKTMIDWEILRKPRSLDDLVKNLSKEKIALVVRRSEEGRVYGLTYVDLNSKSVFNGSDLGKEYAAKGILERLGIEQRPMAQEKEPQLQKQEGLKQKEPSQKEPPLEIKEMQSSKNNNSITKDILKDVSGAITELASPDNTNEALNAELRNEEEKRRRSRNRELER
jgi:hypothetical protein